MPERISIRAGSSSEGKPVLEEVLVEPRGRSTYALVASPGLVLGVAAGDVLEIGAGGAFKLVQRGGNVCVQVFAKAGASDALERSLAEGFAPLGGRVDGRARREVVVTVPVSAGFPGIEAVLAEVTRRHPGIEWYFGNVYDPEDGVTPLNWW